MSTRRNTSPTASPSSAPRDALRTSENQRRRNSRNCQWISLKHLGHQHQRDDGCPRTEITRVAKHRLDPIATRGDELLKCRDGAHHQAATASVRSTGSWRYARTATVHPQLSTAR